MAKSEDFENVNVQWASLFSFTTKAHAIPLTIALLLATLSGIVIPALAYFLGIIFDSFSNYGTGLLTGEVLTQELATWSIYLLYLGIASWIAKGTFFAAWLTFGELQAKSARDQLYAEMLHKDMTWYDKRLGGVDSLAPRLQSYVRELQLATSQPLGFLFQYFVTAIASLVLALYTAWDVTLVIIAGVPFCSVILACISNRIHAAISGQEAAKNQASKVSNNAIIAIDTIKCFNGQNSELWRYIDCLKKGSAYYMQQARCNALQIGLVHFLVEAMFVQGFWYGNHVAETGQKTAGQILTTFWATLIATETIQQILPQMLVLEKGKAAGAALKAVLNEKSSVALQPEVSKLKRPRRCKGRIEFNQVSFIYPSRPDRLALDKASVSFSGGQTTYVLGASGSGKSTLSSLLLKFYEPCAGQIIVDGNDIKDLDPQWLRRNITVVQQKAVLFDDTLRKNIAFGKADYQETDEKYLGTYLELADLFDTVLALPDGLETVIGPGGSSLSGGQKQKVALARARLRDTPVLILDEATSAMDQTSREYVIKGLRKWRQGMTTIIISHDVRHIPDDEYAYFLENGRVLDMGFWKSLKASAARQSISLLDTGKKSTNPFRKSYDREWPLTPTVASMLSSPRLSVATTRFTNFSTPRLSSMDLSSLRAPTYVENSRRHSLSLGTPFALTPEYLGWIPDRRMSILSPPPMSNQLAVPRVVTPSLNQRMPRRVTATRFPIEDMIPEECYSRESGDRASVILEFIQSYSEGAPTPFIDLFKKALGFNLDKSVSSSVGKEVLPLRKIFATIWPNLRTRKRAALVCGFVFAFVHAACTPVFAWVFSNLLAVFFSPMVNRSSFALKWSMAMLAVSLADAIASYMMHYLLEYIGQAWVDKLRTEAMQRILDQPRAWFDQENGSLVLYLDRSAEEMRNLVGRFAALMFVATVMVLIAVVWCMLLCWELTLVGLAAAPLLYAVTRAFESVSKNLEGKCNQAGEVTGSVFSETFTKIATVKALTLESYFQKKHTNATKSALKIGIKRAMCSGLLYGLSDCFVVFMTGVIFWYGGQLVAAAYSVQSIMTVFTMLLFSMSSANGTLAFIPQIKSSQDSATQLLRLAKLPLHSSHEHQGQLRLTSLPGPIKLRDLTFSYSVNANRAVLNSLNLTIPLHRSTALVGASGSGKSTIAALLLGLYEANSGSQLTARSGDKASSGFVVSMEEELCSSGGSITFGPHALSTLHLPTLRAMIGYVPQQIMLLPGTIAENIAYGFEGRGRNKAFDADALSRAANLASIDDFVSSLPDGYQTLVGEGGTQLSGGQVQRLGIARALLRQPQLLIMDEPTSALDSKNAAQIRATIKGVVASGMTVLVITHDAEMMRAMGGIVVVEAGRVVEQGNWHELVLKRDGKLVDLLGDLLGREPKGQFN